MQILKSPTACSMPVLQSALQRRSSLADVPMFHETRIEPSWNDRRFIFLLNAYRPHGGLARGSGQLNRCTARRGLTAEAVQQWIDQKLAFGFSWAEVVWLPHFQFGSGCIEPKPALKEILAELVPAFDDWEVAAWFVEPNDWLAGCCPVESLGAHCEDVVAAARADRHIATG